jgi:hypothetical protein
LVDDLQGSGHAKKRLQLMLETISGTRTVSSACEELGINEAAFHKLRTRTLQEALEGLEPRPLGRPRHEASPEEIEIEQLTEEIRDLKLRLQASRLREEVATVMPHVLKPTTSSEPSRRKKTKHSKRKPKRKRK